MYSQMHEYSHICIHTYVYSYTCIHTLMYRLILTIHTCTLTHMHILTCTLIHTFICAHMHTHAPMHPCTLAHTPPTYTCTLAGMYTLCPEVLEALPYGAHVPVTLQELF